MATDWPLARAVGAVAIPAGLPAELVDGLAAALLASGLCDDAMLDAVRRLELADWYEVAAALARGGDDEKFVREFCSCVYDCVFSSAELRKEVRYGHPMDDLR